MHVLLSFLDRFRGDFWPLDRSFVGPNLVASAVLFIPAAFYAEIRIVRKLHKHHESIRQEMRAMAEAALHPTERVEEHIADDVVDDLQARPLTEETT